MSKNHPRNNLLTFAEPIHSYITTDLKENIENLNTEYENSVFGRLKTKNIDKWFKNNISNSHKSQNHIICPD